MYEAFGKIGIQECNIIEKLINMFSDVITVERTENILIFKDNNKTIEIPLMDVEFIETPTKFPEIELGEKISVEAEKINNFIKDISINQEINIIFKSVEKGLLLSNKGKYKFTTKIETNSASGGFTSRFTESLIKSISNLNGVLNIDFESDKISWFQSLGMDEKIWKKYNLIFKENIGTVIKGKSGLELFM